MSVGRRIAVTVAGLATIAGAGLATAPTAAAASCAPSQPCLWLFYNSENKGSHFLTTKSISNLAGYTFTTAGAGKGLTVKNNAASANFRADNNFYTSSGSIFYSSGYNGPCEKLESMENGIVFAPRLVRTYNENASVKLLAGYSNVGNHPKNCYNW
ncbi:hypothetical protein [Streptomyces sp. NPDC000410]|uniref:hypothetical protein n=1 Tax=Streptomyces sp. NPDC000410 TaxID=3154254 RepID=UPI0033293842